MKIVLKVFLLGAVINIMTAPFLFSQGVTDSRFEYEFQKPLLKLKPVKLFPGNTPTYIVKVSSFKKMDSLITDTTLTTVKPKENVTKKFRMRKSPTKAVLLSAVLPGAGQFYNESYWKIPIIAGLVGYFGYEFFRNNNLYKDNRDLYVNSQTPEIPNGDLNYKTLREFYRDQRDDFVWYFLIVYVVSMVDAYVDAHLFDFDVKNEKLSGFGEPNKTYRLKFNLKF